MLKSMSALGLQQFCGVLSPGLDFALKYIAAYEPLQNSQMFVPTEMSQEIKGNRNLSVCSVNTQRV